MIAGIAAGGDGMAMVVSPVALPPAGSFIRRVRAGPRRAKLDFESGHCGGGRHDERPGDENGDVRELIVTPLWQDFFDAGNSRGGTNRSNR